MKQISILLTDEDLAELKAQAKFKALRPLTYAAYLLTTSVRGHESSSMREDWERLESTTQHVVAMKAAGYDRAKVDPKALSTEPEELEKRHGWAPNEDVVSRKELRDLGATSIDIVSKGKKSRITSHEG